MTTVARRARSRARSRARPRPSSHAPRGRGSRHGVTFDALHMRSTIQYSTWAPYHWLLDREDFDESPTWWDDATREKLLKGSHVLELARKAAEDFEHDWDVVKEELADMAVEAKLYPLIPTDFLRETFRRAVAAIHSRSFNAAVPGQETSERLRGERAHDPGPGPGLREPPQETPRVPLGDRPNRKLGAAQALHRQVVRRRRRPQGL